MGTFSAWHWLIVLAICLLLFGRGKIPQLMADLGRGISEFKKGIRDPEDGDRQRRDARSCQTDLRLSADASSVKGQSTLGRSGVPRLRLALACFHPNCAS